MRLFLASPVIVYDYTGLHARYAPSLRGRWTPAEQLHLTWHFLGELPAPDKPLAWLSRLRAPRCTLLLEGIGRIGPGRKILAALSRDPAIDGVVRNLREAGVPTDRFRPHATFCRIKAIRDPKALRQSIRDDRHRILGMVLPRIALIHSTLTPDGPVYRVLAEVGD